MDEREQRALMRPAPASQVAMSIGVIALGLCVLAFTTGLTGLSTVVAPAVLSLPCGFVWNAVCNQGAWLFDRAIVLEAVMGRAVIPLEDVIEVHIDEAMTTLGVRTADHYVVQSLATPLALNMPAGARDRTVRLFRNRNIRCVWHDGLADVYRVASATSPFMWPGAVLGTLRRPLVWGSVLAGLAYGSILLWAASAG
ncbi:MAG: hypothetical protein NVV57_10440 [Demequina sp.]|nr:hypothetical protein [Demequina sp.]